MAAQITSLNTKAFHSMREWIAYLEQTKRLVRAKKGVPLKYTLAAIAKQLDGDKAVLFPNPDHHPISVVSGIVSKRDWIAEAMGVSNNILLEHFREAVLNPIPWKEIKKAPAQEIVIRKNIDINSILPIPTHNEHDSGAYITAGLVIARNPQSGEQNVSINRLQINGPDTLGILILPRDLNKFFEIAEHRNQSLPVSISIGSDPMCLLASQAILPLNADELGVAGGLLKNPLNVVKCVTNDVRVPASSEIIIEGRLLPHVRESEGPFGEFPQYYGPAGKRQVIKIDTITHRENPIYHTIVPAAMEHLLLALSPGEASILTALQRQFSNVIDVHLSRGGVCRYHLAVKVKQLEGEQKNIIFGAFASHADVKLVTIVDEDVDVHDPTAVEWAVATRFQASSILLLWREHSVQNLTLLGRMDCEIMGLDATKPIESEPLRYTIVSIPGEEDETLIEQWVD